MLYFVIHKTVIKKAVFLCKNSLKNLTKNMTKEEATLKVKGLKGNITDEQLSKKIGISQPTFYTRLLKSNWKKGEIELIKNL